METLFAELNALQARPDNRRIDWAMRQFVDEVLGVLSCTGDRANAAMHLYERGVPLHVARRVLAH